MGESTESTDARQVPYIGQLRDAVSNPSDEETCNPLILPVSESLRRASSLSDASSLPSCLNARPARQELKQEPHKPEFPFKHNLKLLERVSTGIHLSTLCALMVLGMCMVFGSIKCKEDLCDRAFARYVKQVSEACGEGQTCNYDILTFPIVAGAIFIAAFLIWCLVYFLYWLHANKLVLRLISLVLAIVLLVGLVLIGLDLIPKGSGDAPVRKDDPEMRDIIPSLLRCNVALDATCLAVGIVSIVFGYILNPSLSCIQIFLDMQGVSLE